MNSYTVLNKIIFLSVLVVLAACGTPVPAAPSEEFPEPAGLADGEQYDEVLPVYPHEDPSVVPPVVDPLDPPADTENTTDTKPSNPYSLKKILLILGVPIIAIAGLIGLPKLWDWMKKKFGESSGGPSDGTESTHVSGIDRDHLLPNLGAGEPNYDEWKNAIKNTPLTVDQTLQDAKDTGYDQINLNTAPSYPSGYNWKNDVGLVMGRLEGGFPSHALNRLAFYYKNNAGEQVDMLQYIKAEAQREVNFKGKSLVPLNDKGQAVINNTDPGRIEKTIQIFLRAFSAKMKN